MVKNPVKVYARLRTLKSNNEATIYSVRKKDDFDILTLYKYAKRRNKYRFHLIFEQNSTQEDVFENTTRPVVNSVLHGFNGTIFAYGQTGSGKTYSMTGCADEYANRGIIPRCLQEIFQFTNKSPDQYTIFISYMEIYNEIGYDLLNPKHQATRLEELPRVTLLDDGKGECHLRNLSMLPVLTEQEAMRLLFLGDTNRTIAETPMNDYSSRSHCIFTIYITRTENERKIRRSKLNLVDLAGSERIYKTNISGTTLTEAKNINLSLHYLEQVILALSQSKRSHIPFRNSLMTYMLRDSLAGNSITVMLATLSVKSDNLEETVTTCNFSQRVALVNTDATINELFDPLEEINYLRNEVLTLKSRLCVPTNLVSSGKVLSKTEIGFCKTFVQKFIESGVWNEGVTLNLEQCIKCFEIFREDIRKTSESQPTDEVTRTNADIVDKFKEIIKQKDEEIDILTQLLETYELSKNQQIGTNTSNELTESIASKDSDSSKTSEIIEESSMTDQELFEEFLNQGNNNMQLNNLKAQIESKYQSANQISAFVESCQLNILKLRRKLEVGFGITDPGYIRQIQSCLKSQQAVYVKSIEELQNLKEETDFLEHGYNQENIRLQQKFKNMKPSPTLKATKTNNAEKSVSDSGIFAKINESLKKIERKFSPKFGKKKDELLVKVESVPLFTESTKTQNKSPKEYVESSNKKTKRHSKHSIPSTSKSSIVIPIIQSKSSDPIYNKDIPSTSQAEHNNDHSKYKFSNHNPIENRSKASESDLSSPHMNIEHDVASNFSNLEKVTETDVIRRIDFGLITYNNLKAQNLNRNIASCSTDNAFTDADNTMTKACSSNKLDKPTRRINLTEKNIKKLHTENASQRNNLNVPSNLNAFKCSMAMFEENSEENDVNFEKIMKTYLKSVPLDPRKDKARQSDFKDSRKVSFLNLTSDRDLNSPIASISETHRESQKVMELFENTNFFNKNNDSRMNEECEHIPEKDINVFNHNNDYNLMQPVQQESSNNEIKSSAFLASDSEEFIEFIKTIPLTDDPDVDEEIIKFYRSKFTQD